jgi:predicted DNA-binding transcriptional regulator AlpA
MRLQRGLNNAFERWLIPKCRSDVRRGYQWRRRSVRRVPEKEQTGFFGTIAVSSTNHGKDSTQTLVDWIKSGKQPPADTQTTGKLGVWSGCFPPSVRLSARSVSWRVDAIRALLQRP